jgi:hypothetical protein
MLLRADAVPPRGRCARTRVRLASHHEHRHLHTSGNHIVPPPSRRSQQGVDPALRDSRLTGSPRAFGATPVDDQVDGGFWSAWCWRQRTNALVRSAQVDEDRAGRARVHRVPDLAQALTSAASGDPSSARHAHEEAVPGRSAPSREAGGQAQPGRRLKTRRARPLGDAHLLLRHRCPSPVSRWASCPF